MGGGGRAGRVKSPVCCADRRPGYLRVAARKARTGAPAGAARCRAPSPGSEPAEATAGSPGKPRPGRRRPRGWVAAQTTGRLARRGRLLATPARSSSLVSRFFPLATHKRLDYTRCCPNEIKENEKCLLSGVSVHYHPNCSHFEKLQRRLLHLPRESPFRRKLEHK